jgi:hypothetical protein
LKKEGSKIEIRGRNLKSEIIKTPFLSKEGPGVVLSRKEQS